MAKRRNQPTSPAARAEADAPPLRLLDIAQVSALLGVTPKSVYQSVKSGRLPRPCYPTPGSARWLESELVDAVRATQMLPSEAEGRRLNEARQRARERRAQAGAGQGSGPPVSSSAVELS